ncbi:MAG TPA: MmgE/PrpD family protein [Anaeromyxobacteraceae bacterium]|nr:MmgE/PrpD family protein [Anaeromyxobacteraceae bacterium]
MALGRRSFMRIAATVAASGALPAATATAEDKGAAIPPASRAPSPPPPVTHALARWAVAARFEDLPSNVRKEATRTLLNYVGVTVGGSHHETVDIAVSALSPFSGPPQATLLGRRERFDVMNAAFVNGVSSHVLDYDDTHLKTIIHPGGPIISALFAASEFHPIDGRAFVNALALGVEAALRIGNCVYPDHYDRGWHITGTVGPLGAAIATGRVFGIDEQRMVWALGLAASQPVGLRESFGSMNKSFNPGRAAANGLFAAILASKGFTSSEEMIEARRGWAHTISTKQDFNEVTSGLGQRWEATLNTYKPFACGIVLHPAIDAAIQLRNEHHLVPSQIEAVELRVNPLVLELTGKKAPGLGLQGKFSVYHAVAVALVEGAAGEKQFSDRAVQNPTVIALRERIVPRVDPTVTPEQADVTVVLGDGRRVSKHVERAIGSAEVPMSDKALEAKFADLAQEVLSPAQARRLMDLCWNVESLGAAAEIARAAALPADPGL